MQPIKIYKFGGASVRSADGVRNLSRIVGEESSRLLVVVSAMGKTTNALEEVLDHFMQNRSERALERFAQIEEYHLQIIRSLFDGQTAAEVRFEKLCREMRALLREENCREDYDRWYDRIVCYGELISTGIVSEFLREQGIENRWLDMRELLVTDSRYREANVNVCRSAERLCRAAGEAPERVLVAQGFIGATPAGHPTTLGREGSDYSAAMAGYLLGAESVTIWKDVDGILSADPRQFSDTVQIPELSYLDAIELAYAGAQVIHPKTIKPLQNKNIPLYVRPFGDCSKPGSVICAEPSAPPSVPVRILKCNQVLISIRPKDFSFVLEERLSDIFSVFGQYRQKINLIQSSAVNLSVCVDASRYLERVVDTLQTEFRVVYNRDVELLTIRGYDKPTYDRYASADGVYLVQKTRRTARIVRARSL